jgi:putative nucleotidyltransferase with HDIG domain
MMANLRTKWLQSIAIALLLASVLAGHWITPDKTHAFHVVHIVFQKLFILPVILAAVWFGMRGSVLVSALSTLLYLPFIAVRLSGHAEEAMAQYGEIATIWITAVLTGIFVDRERAVMRDVARMHEGALIALVNALDARERNTHLHSLRVSAYAKRIGRAMALDERALASLGEGALLHDVGKIGVPDAILLKPGPLTDEEWFVMRQHPEIGRKILEPAPFLREAAEIVYTHHERYDGTGYPRALRGEDIPLAARIFSVADVFDALTTERPYHRKMDPEQAAREIQEGAGKQFDSAVVQTFSTISPSEWHEIAQNIVAGVPEEYGETAHSHWDR